MITLILQLITSLLLLLASISLCFIIKRLGGSLRSKKEQERSQRQIEGNKPIILDEEDEEEVMQEFKKQFIVHDYDETIT